MSISFGNLRLRLAVGVSIGILLLLAILALYMVFRTHDPVPLTSLRSNTLPELVGTPNPLIQDHQIVVEETDSSSTTQTDLAYVWDACPIEEWETDFYSVRDYLKTLDISQECGSALDNHFVSKSPFDNYSLVLLNERFTYERLFADPKRNLDLVVDALVRPECVFRDKTVAKWELKDSCNAEAFAEYAAFYKVCFASPTPYRFLRTTLADYVELSGVPRNSMNEIWKLYLEKHWVRQRCQEFDPSLQLSKEFYQPHHEQLLSIASAPDRVYIFGGYEKTTEEVLLYTALLSLGARLGSEAASLQYNPGSDSLLQDFLNEKQPWREAYDAFSIERRQGYEMLRALDLVVSLEDSEIQFDWERLVEHLCVRFKSSKGNCQTMITHYRDKFDQTEDRKLQILDKFERIAIERNAYN